MQTKRNNKENKRKLRFAGRLWTMRIVRIEWIAMALVGQLAGSFCFSIGLCVRFSMPYTIITHRLLSSYSKYHFFYCRAFYASCSFDISGYFFCLDRFSHFSIRHSDRWFIAFVLFHILLSCVCMCGVCVCVSHTSVCVCVFECWL